MQQYLIIVAGGIGSRMKSDRPKQFLEIQGEPVIVRTIRKFLQYNPAMQVIISVHRNYKSHLEGLLDKYNLREFNIRITFGGDTRYASVRNGLMLIEDESAVVGIHDAARPFVSQATIRNCYETASLKGNAVPCITVNDSLRKISNNVNNSVNRNEYRIVQTPQCFIVKKIKNAFQSGYSSSFTDDATVLESTGEVINLVEGNEENLKITSPLDLLIAGTLAAREEILLK